MLLKISLSKGNLPQKATDNVNLVEAERLVSVKRRANFSNDPFKSLIFKVNLNLYAIPLQLRFGNSARICGVTHL